jgi:hypothetical protein
MRERHSFLAGQAKGEILWKSLLITLDGLVESPGLDTVDFGEISREYNALASENEDRAFDRNGFTTGHNLVAPRRCGYGSSPVARLNHSSTLGMIFVYSLCDRGRVQGSTVQRACPESYRRIQGQPTAKSNFVQIETFNSGALYRSFTE